MWVTKSALTQLMMPVSTSVTWNNVGILGFLAPPSTQIQSAMRQTPSVSVTITVIPDLTCRKAGSDLGPEVPIPWPTGHPLERRSLRLRLPVPPWLGWKRTGSANDTLRWHK